MADPRLTFYVKAITTAHEIALKTVREQAGEEVWVGIDFPEVILILSGLIVNGRVVSYLEYLKRVRGSITIAPGDEDIKKSILGLFAEPNPLLGSEEDVEHERIYLINVVFISGESRFSCDQISIQLDSVQGWTMGQCNFS